MVAGMTASELLAACLLDAAVGDPRWMPHPVKVMGAAIARYEAIVRHLAHSPSVHRIAGLVLAVGLPLVVAAATMGIIELAARIHPSARTAVVVVLSFTALAARDLVDHIKAVLRALERGSLVDA